MTAELSNQVVPSVRVTTAVMLVKFTVDLTTLTFTVFFCLYSESDVNKLTLDVVREMTHVT